VQGAFADETNSIFRCTCAGSLKRQWQPEKSPSECIAKGFRQTH